MNRRTIITILVGVLIAALIGGVWWWFFAAGGGPAPKSAGSFGNAGDRTTTTTQEPSQPTNIPTPIPQGGQQTGSGGIGAAGTYYIPPIAAGSPTSSAPTGVSWLGGSPSSGSGSLGGGSGTPFNPAAINQLNNGQVGGQVNVLGTFSTPNSGSGSSNGTGLAIGAIAGTAVACSAFLIGGAAGLSSASLTSVSVNAPTDNTKNFMDCLARTIARAAIQQLTNSVVNWINSGFNGSPSFITNYQQFFASVADQAAGEYIANVAKFAPYCTPFRAQIRVALAQSYARRNTAQSCTLSQLLGTNTSSLFGGSGPAWGNFLSFTTVPANNPYGAYSSAQVGLYTTIGSATGNANRYISPTGFISFQQPYDCQNPSNNGGGGVTVGGGTQAVGYSCPSNCKCKVTTPGSVIESSLNKTLGTSLDSLNLAKSFDEIISALITQLMSRALYGGVSNLSGTGGYAQYYLTPDQQQAQSLGQEVLTEMQGLVVVAQQYGQSEQGSISDIESTQQQLSNLANCWQTAASSTQDTAKQNLAMNNAQSALNTLHSYDAQVASLNTEVTRANAAVAILQQLQTQTLNVQSTGDVGSIRTALAGYQSQGRLVATADVTQAQQDRSSLQAQLASVNQGAQTGLQQCYAFH